MLQKENTQDPESQSEVSKEGANRRTCGPTANGREGQATFPNVSGLELCGSSDHPEVAEPPRVRQAGNPAELGTGKGDEPHLSSPPSHIQGTLHVPESSPRGPGSTPPCQKGSRSGTPRNVRPSTSEIKQPRSRNPETTSPTNGSKIKGKRNKEKKRKK